LDGYSVRGSTTSATSGSKRSRPACTRSSSTCRTRCWSSRSYASGSALRLVRILGRLDRIGIADPIHVLGGVCICVLCVAHAVCVVRAPDTRGVVNRGGVVGATEVVNVGGAVNVVG